jgi:hypothetical protein
VRQETKRPSDAKPGPTLGPIPLVMVVAVRHETPSHLTTKVLSVVLMRLVVFWPVGKRKGTDKPVVTPGAP